MRRRGEKAIKFPTDRMRAIAKKVGPSRQTSLLAGSISPARGGTEEDGMSAIGKQAIVLGTTAFVAMSAESLPPTTAGGGFKIAVPLSHEETIYRPECPTSETSAGWLSCRLADVNGG
jgi:hypothetical protein